MDTGDETEQASGARTQEEVNRRRRKRRKEQSRTVVNPDENFYFYWLMTVTVCVLYNLWTLIVRQSFPELQRDSSAFWYACDGFTDVVFVCDIAVQFRTGYLEQGLMVRFRFPSRSVRCCRVPAEPDLLRPPLPVNSDPSRPGRWRKVEWKCR